METYLLKHRVFNFRSVSENFFHCDWDLYPRRYLRRKTNVIARLNTGTFQKSSLDASALVRYGVGFSFINAIMVLASIAKRPLSFVNLFKDFTGFAWGLTVPYKGWGYIG